MPSRIAKSVKSIWIGAEMIPSDSSTELTSPSLRMTSWIAKARISMLVQKGMVIRKSQIERLCGGRVAMK